jgi:hypothetical protein
LSHEFFRLLIKFYLSFQLFDFVNQEILAQLGGLHVQFHLLDLAFVV